MDESNGVWTIEELGERAAGALAGAGYAGVPSGRVRDVPDPRTIRYYTTLGLLDRPAGSRGRTALYGPRHLLQLVAIKRMQARGRTLGEVQREVAGATDASLGGVAGVAAPASAHPWAAPRLGAAAPGRLAAGPPPLTPPAAGRTAAFWRETPPPPTPPGVGAVVPMQAVRLGEGATLILATRRPLGDDDLRVVGLAPAPMLELWKLRGLMGPGAAGDGDGGGRGPNDTQFEEGER